MRVSAQAAAPESASTELLAVLVARDQSLDGLAELDRLTQGVLGRAWALGDFRGRDGERLMAYGPGDGSGGARRVLFLGVGASSPDGGETLRLAAGGAVRAAEGVRARSLALCLSRMEPEPNPRGVQSAVEGLVLASWRYDDLRSDPGSREADPRAPQAGRAGDPDGGDSDSGDSDQGGAGQARAAAPAVESAVVLCSDADAASRHVAVGRAFAAGENRARTLQAMPGNVATPARLAREAARIADRAGLEIEVLGPNEMEAESMGALLSVARGTSQEPRLIVLRHRGGDPDDPPLVLVGKGLTFDAGGISIKPAKGMENMKYDMSGGAAVLGAMHAIGRLGVAANVTGVVPSSENLLGASATKPGDVVVSRAGKSIEVINTDAEGRLILADALDYAADWKPAAMVDCATLTGACVIALGHHRSAVLGNSDEVVRELQEAGDRAGQPCWPLPLDPEYRRQLDCDVADLKNVGGRPAGTITASAFLAEFVRDVPWAHLDIAGTAYGKTDRTYLKDGPHGRPCRLLLEWVRARCSPGFAEGLRGPDSRLDEPD